MLADVGFSRPTAVREAEDIAASVSGEQIGRADADVIYTTTYGPEQATQKARAEQLWRGLPAVPAGRVHAVSDDSWMLAVGLTGADLILGDLEHTLARR